MSEQVMVNKFPKNPYVHNRPPETERMIEQYRLSPTIVFQRGDKYIVWFKVGFDSLTEDLQSYYPYIGENIYSSYIDNSQTIDSILKFCGYTGSWDSALPQWFWNDYFEKTNTRPKGFWYYAPDKGYLGSFLPLEDVYRKLSQKLLPIFWGLNVRGMSEKIIIKVS